MDLRQISPDQVVFWQWGFLSINATILFTWALMAILVLGSWLITRKLETGSSVPRWQNLLEVLVSFMRDQIRNIAQDEPRPYLPFIGSLFLFIGIANLFMLFPWYIPPTASLSTTTALALCVFVAVPAYGIADLGFTAYFRRYIRPTALMLPFNVIGEFSRTLALAVRLFGNIMSGTKIVAILLAVIPFVLPVVMQLLGILTGLLQAYIFGVLATVYIASARRARGEKGRGKGEENTEVERTKSSESNRKGDG
jgi:F-type H+-transporting ATPase subunit a